MGFWAFVPSMCVARPHLTDLAFYAEVILNVFQLLMKKKELIPLLLFMATAEWSFVFCCIFPSKI